MFPGMMDPEMMRLAQEQMSRMSPADLSRIQQQGNESHSQGRFNDALEKYMRAKNNLKGVPASKGGALLLACSLNLLSCYLKTGQYDECIKEGTEVLANDARNVKALYRRGQAYKSLGQLEKAVSDLSQALELSPEDETIADVLRDAKEGLIEQGYEGATGGIRIEEIKDDEVATPISEKNEASSSESSDHVNKVVSSGGALPTNSEYLQDKDSIRSFQNFMSQADPETLASLGSGKFENISPDMVKTASSLINKMPPEEFQKMLQMATSFQGENPLLNRSSNNNNGSGMPNFTPDMLKTATDMMSKMPAEELQKMFEMASSFNGQNPMAAESSGLRSSDRSNISQGQESQRSSSDGESGSSQGFLNSRVGPQPSFPSSSSDIRSQLKNPAMREMMSSMMKNMSPDMMANMSQQFGVKLSREDAERAQQAMSSLSPENLDRLMKWADRIQRVGEGAVKTKKLAPGEAGVGYGRVYAPFCRLSPLAGIH